MRNKLSIIILTAILQACGGSGDGGPSEPSIDFQKVKLELQTEWENMKTRDYSYSSNGYRMALLGGLSAKIFEKYGYTVSDLQSEKNKDAYSKFIKELENEF
tara:strand:+ start:3533 stop:3838 length:306 start_codon:yes stop_codon:yes gene_type:complete